MTVMRQTNVAGPFQGNGSTTQWEYKFRVDEPADFFVYLRDWATKIDVLIPPSEYAVTGIGSGSEEGGTVTYPLVGDPIGPEFAIVIEREVKYIQQVSISNNGGFYPKVVEQAFDNLQFQIQQLAEKVGRAPATPVGEIPLTIVPEPFDRLMYVDNNGFMRSSETTRDERSQRIAADAALGQRVDKEISDRASAVANEAYLREAGDKSVASLIGQAGPIETQVYDTRTAAALSTVKPTIQTVRTGGFFAAGDGGGALYKRSPVEPDHEGKFQSADGAWWEIAPDEKGSPAQLGAASLDGLTDISASMQNWMDWTVGGMRAGFWPTAAGQRYFIGDTITAVKSDLSIIGDMGPVRYSAGQGGYITGPETGLRALVDWGNGQAVTTGALHLEKLPFYRSTRADYPAVLSTNNNNGPMRGTTLRDVSCRGFEALIKILAPGTNYDPSYEDQNDNPNYNKIFLGGACNLTLDNCNVLGCDYSILALSRVLNGKVVGNQIEQGAKIHGLLDGTWSITDNMMEGQSNAVRVYDVSRCKLYLARNYFEAQSGDYTVSFEAQNRDSELVIDENYGWFHDHSCTDLIVLRGSSKLRILPDQILVQQSRDHLITLDGWTGAMADFNGQGFYAYADKRTAFFAPLNNRYAGRSTDGWDIVNDFGANGVETNTPYGIAARARKEKGFRGQYTTVSSTPSVGDVLVSCILMKVDMNDTLADPWEPETSYSKDDLVSVAGVNYLATGNHTSSASFQADRATNWVFPQPLPRLAYYNSTYSSTFTMGSGMRWAGQSGEWLLMVGVNPVTFDGSSGLRFRIGANGTDNDSHFSITVASLATKVIPASEFDEHGRISVDPIIPPILSA